jgi:hypothetical protein
MTDRNDRPVSELAPLSVQEMEHAQGGAQVDYFLKIDTLDGESTSRAGHGGGGQGKVSMQDFHFVMIR